MVRPGAHEISRTDSKEELLGFSYLHKDEAGENRVAPGLLSLRIRKHVFLLGRGKTGWF